MATTARSAGAAPKPITADGFEHMLAIGAITLLGFVIAALARGHAYWDRVPLLIWLHLGTIIIALALTPMMLLRRRGNRTHRRLGTIWVAAMLGTALISFAIRYANHGQFSIIHILSVWTLIQAPIIWWSARQHRVARHRSAVRGMVTGALLIAGFFTFPFDRLLGQFLFG